MKTSITISSWGALLIAAFFAAVTARTLFDDVLTGAPITVAHMQSLAAIVGAIASGHMLLPMLKQAKLATLLGMAIIFVSSTAYVVISAGARNSIATQAKQIDAERQNADYAAALDKLADAEADLKAAKDTAKVSAAAAAKECSSGKKTKCEGREATRDYDAKQVEKAESHVMMMQARVKVTKPVADPHAGYAHAAKVLAALPYVTAEPDEIERRLDLLLPFATVLISEIGLLVFGALAIGHTATPGNRAAAVKTAATFPATVGNDNDGCEGCPPPTGGKRATLPAGNSRTVASKAAAESDVIRLVARGEQLPSQDVLAARWGVHKGTASKWLQDFERRGLIARHREGRAKRVAAA